MAEIKTSVGTKAYPGTVGMTRTQIEAFEALREALTNLRAHTARYLDHYPLPGLEKQVDEQALVALALADKVSR
jgi:hypothetical protein